jgi:hypothetical protein
MWLAFSRLVPAAGGGARNPQRLPEPTGSGTCCFRPHSALTEALGLGLRRPALDASFRSFFHQVVVAALCAAIRDRTIAQIPSGAADLAQLVCNGKTLRGSIKPMAGGGSAFIAQDTLYSAALAVADFFSSRRLRLRRSLTATARPGLRRHDREPRAGDVAAAPGAGARRPPVREAAGFSEGVEQPEDVALSDPIHVPGQALDPFWGK